MLVMQPVWWILQVRNRMGISFLVQTVILNSPKNDMLTLFCNLPRILLKWFEQWKSTMRDHCFRAKTSWYHEFQPAWNSDRFGTCDEKKLSSQTKKKISWMKEWIHSLRWSSSRRLQDQWAQWVLTGQRAGCVLRILFVSTPTRDGLVVDVASDDVVDIASPTWRCTGPGQSPELPHTPSISTHRPKSSDGRSGWSCVEEMGMGGGEEGL